MGQKRFVRASPHKEVPNAKRSALGDLTNNVAGKRAGPVKPTKRESLTHRPVTRSMSDKKDQEKEPVEQKCVFARDIPFANLSTVDVFPPK